MSDYENRKIREVKLPDWIQEVEDATAKAIIGQLDKYEANVLFRQHAGDLCLKIRQLTVELEMLKEDLAETQYARNWLWHHVGPHEMTYPEFLNRMGALRMKELGEQAKTNTP